MRLVPLGEKVMGVRIEGDQRKPEPETVRIAFPWGDVEVTRATDGVSSPDYWVHIFVNNPGSPNYCPDRDCGAYAGPGRLKAARLDQTDKAAAAADLGDFERPELYHLAVRVGPGEEAPHA